MGQWRLVLKLFIEKYVVSTVGGLLSRRNCIFINIAFLGGLMERTPPPPVTRGITEEGEHTGTTEPTCTTLVAFRNLLMSGFRKLPMSALAVS